MRSSNRQGYASAKEVFRRDLPDLVNEIKNDPNYKGLLDDEDAVLKEVFERYSGKRGAERLEEMAKQGKEGLVNRIKDFLNKAWGWVAENVFNVKSFRNAEEIADMALKDMLDGTDLGKVKSRGVGFDVRSDLANIENVYNKMLGKAESHWDKELLQKLRTAHFKLKTPGNKAVRTDRICKYNQLMRIEELLGNDAIYPGRNFPFRG